MNISDYGKEEKNELVDIGFNLVFCKDDGEVNLTIENFILTKRVPNTLIGIIDVYYILKK